MAVASAPRHGLTRQELEGYKRRLAETSDVTEKARILRELGDRLAEMRDAERLPKAS
jgi:hypothetical protein